MRNGSGDPAQTIKFSLAAALGCCQLVVSFAPNKSVLYYPRFNYYVVAVEGKNSRQGCLKKFAPIFFRLCSDAEQRHAYKLIVKRKLKLS